MSAPAEEPRPAGVADDGDDAGVDRDELVDATLAWLRKAHADVAFGALDEAAQPCPVPESLGLRPGPSGEGYTPSLDIVAPEDRVAVIRAWERARQRGVAQVNTHRVDGSGVNVYFVDLADRVGVMLVAIVPDDTTAPVAVDTGPPLPPRVCTMRRDQQAAIVEVDAAAVEIFGWSLAEVVGEPSLKFIHPDDTDRGIANWLEMLAAPHRPHRWRGRYQKADGTWLWLDITNHNRLDDPDHNDVLSEMVDISDEMSVHEALREREELLRELTDALPVGVVQFDADRQVVHENERLAAIVGASGLDGLLAAVVDDDRDDLEAAVAAVLGGGGPEPIEVRLAGDRVCRVSFRPLLHGGLACVDDVTEPARLRRELEIRATFDSLTECFSRSAILGALDQVADEGPGTGVVFVDLDRFKPVNDAYGHAAGDALLVAVGERLRASVREIDMVGRLGGDEFLVVCPGVSGPDAVAAIARRVAARLDDPLAIGGDLVLVPRASIGVAWAPAGTDTAALVARADAAMYESKRSVDDGDEGQPGALPNSPTKLTISPG